MPVHESPFVPCTVQEETLVPTQEMTDLSPTRRRDGVALRVAEGGETTRQAPDTHP